MSAQRLGTIGDDEKLGRKGQQNAGGAEVYHCSLESQAETVSPPFSRGLEERVINSATFKYLNQQGGTYHTEFTASGHASVSLGNNLTINNYGTGRKDDTDYDSSWTVKSKIPKRTMCHVHLADIIKLCPAGFISTKCRTDVLSFRMNTSPKEPASGYSKRKNSKRGRVCPCLKKARNLCWS